MEAQLLAERSQSTDVGGADGIAATSAPAAAWAAGGRGLLWLVDHGAGAPPKAELPSMWSVPDKPSTPVPDRAATPGREPPGPGILCQNFSSLCSPSPDGYWPSHGGYRAPPRAERGAPPKTSGRGARPSSRPSNAAQRLRAASQIPGSRASPDFDGMGPSTTRFRTRPSPRCRRSTKAPLFARRETWVEMAEERRQQDRERQEVLRNMRSMPFEEWHRAKYEGARAAVPLEKRLPSPKKDSDKEELAAKALALKQYWVDSARRGTLRKPGRSRRESLERTPGERRASRSSRGPH